MSYPSRLNLAAGLEQGFHDQSIRSDNEVVAEIEFVIESIEKVLARWQVESSNSPARDAMLPIAILSSSGYIGSIISKNSSPFLSAEPTTIIYMISVLLLAIYFIGSIIARYRRNRHNSVLLKSQAESALETLKLLRSWMDRSEMSYRLKILMETRAKYLEALVIQSQEIATKNHGIIHF